MQRAEQKEFRWMYARILSYIRSLALALFGGDQICRNPGCIQRNDWWNLSNALRSNNIALKAGTSMGEGGNIRDTCYVLA